MNEHNTDHTAQPSEPQPSEPQPSEPQPSEPQSPEHAPEHAYEGSTVGGPQASTVTPAPAATPDVAGAGVRGAAVSHASGHENPTDSAESLGTGLGDHATGDIVIDAALQDLQSASPDDLDAQIDAGQRVQQTLQARLSDLGGE